MINWEKVDQINLGYKVLLAAGKYSEYLREEIYRYMNEYEYAVLLGLINESEL